METKTNENWLNFRKENLEAITKKMLFAYKKDSLFKAEIAEALTLWAFSRQMECNDDRKDFLLSIIRQGELNDFARLVAMIECLPDRVWRKLLWKENLDFMSFESFLRRVTQSQYDVIETNFKQIFEKKVIPEVMKRTFWNKIKNFFHKISVYSLLQENYELGVRNQSKSAWAFNLLNLDFGFSLYSQGENNDTKITNKSWTRFLSVKEHINDFVVDQEQGKYWWLYRTARSNYVLRPNETVQLKNHICPGFWATFVFHLIFWIASPVLFTVTLYWLFQTNEAALLAPLILTSITPLWIIIAIVKLIKKALIYLIGDVIIDKIDESEKAKKILKIIGYSLLGCIIFALAFVAIFVIGKVIIFFVPILGKIMAVLFTLSVSFYALQAIIAGFNEGWDFYEDDTPKWMKSIARFSFFASLLVAFDKYLATIVITAIVDAASWLWEFVVDYPLFCVFIVFIVAISALFAWLLSLEKKSEEVFAKAEKVIMYAVYLLFGVTILFFGIQVGTDYNFIIQFLKPLSILILIGFGISGIVLWQSKKVNSSTIKDLKWADKQLDFFFSEIGQYYKKSNEWNRNLFLFNTSLSKNEDYFPLIIRVKNIVKEIFHYHSNKKAGIVFLEYAISNMTEEFITKIESELGVIKNLDDWEKMFYIRMLFTKPSSAYTYLEIARTEKTQKKEKWEKFFDISLIPLMYLIDGIVFLWEYISKFFLIVKDLWSFFNERCPYVSKPKYLN